jgi:hypothetical protein
MIRGTMHQCFAHMAKRLDQNDFQDIATFVTVTPDTVRTWVKESTLPQGERYIRLRHYLEQAGYTLVELETLDPAVCATGRLVAFNVLTLPEVADLVGYTGGKNAVVTLLQTLKGAHGVSSAKREQFESLVQLYEPKLKVTQRSPQKVVLAEPTTESVAPDMHQAVKESFAKIMAALIPLAEIAVSDSFTAKDREQIRTLTDGAISRLSRLLGQLSGEAARSVLAAKHREGGEL